MSTIARITNLLNQKNVTPSKMMRDLGFSSDLFSQWKSGIQNPSTEKLRKIANYLDVSVDYLLGNEPAEKALDEIDLAVMYEMRKLTDQQKQSVLQYILFLSSEDRHSFVNN